MLPNNCRQSRRRTTANQFEGGSSQDEYESDFIKNTESITKHGSTEEEYVSKS